MHGADDGYFIMMMSSITSLLIKRNKIWSWNSSLLGTGTVLMMACLSYGLCLLIRYSPVVLIKISWAAMSRDTYVDIHERRCIVKFPVVFIISTNWSFMSSSRAGWLMILMMITMLELIMVMAHDLPNSAHEYHVLESWSPHWWWEIFLLLSWCYSLLINLYDHNCMSKKGLVNPVINQ
jgi:hypothetical protein